MVKLLFKTKETHASAICEFFLSLHMHVYMVELLACGCSLNIHVGLDPEHEG